MPEYLFTAVTPEGTRVTERIDGPTVDGARYALEIRRYKEIVFHTDDSTRRMDKSIGREMDPEPCDFQLDPEQELEARRGGGFFSGIWLAWKAHWFVWLPLLLWCGSKIRGGQPYGASGWIAFSLAALFLAYFAVLVTPGVAYQALLRASVWNRLPETRFWSGFLRRLPLISGGMIPKLDLDVRLACVLARNGKIEEGRQRLAPYLAGELDAMTLGRLAGFHDAAGEHEVACQLRRRAVTLSNGGVSETIDEALSLARHLHRPAEARACLVRIADRELVEVARIFVNYIEGLIALEEKKFPEAAALFEKAAQSLQPMGANELMKGMLRDMWAFQSLALARVGRVAEARALLAKARPMLAARRETELLQQCREAVGR